MPDLDKLTFLVGILFFYFYRVSPLHRNNNKDTALHTAIKLNYPEAINELINVFGKGIDVNSRDTEFATPLHTALKTGNTDAIKLLIHAGGNLAAQDSDGMTPLHYLVQAAAADQDNLKNYLQVWDVIVDNCVYWWCQQDFWQEAKRTVPSENSPAYQACTFDAMFLLRTELGNNERLSVLQYAAKLELPTFVNYMLTDEKAFLAEIPKMKEKMGAINEAEQHYFINVTHLIPEFSRHYGSVHYMDGTKCSHDLAEKMTGLGELRIRSLEETMVKLDKPTHASAVFEANPMQDLAQKKWMTYQWVFILFILVHVALMLWFSIETSNELKNDLEATSNGNVPGNINQNTADVVVFIYAVLILVILFAGFVTRQITQYNNIIKNNAALRKSKSSVDNKMAYIDVHPNISRKRGEAFSFREIIPFGRKRINEFIEDKGSFFNLPLGIVSFFSNYLLILVTMTFCGCMIAAFALDYLYDGTEKDMYGYVDAKSIAMVCGWLILVFPARSFSYVYNFTTIMRYIFLRDLVPFGAFVTIIMTAFAYGIQIQFQKIPEANLVDDGQHYDYSKVPKSTATVMFQLLLMGVGMDTELSDVNTVSEIFIESNVNELIIECLLTIYGIITILVLLNLIIALMGSTYEYVREQQGKGWRQHHVSACYF